MSTKKITLAVTGASGTPLSRQILTDLVSSKTETSLIISEWAEKVSLQETGESWQEWLKKQKGKIRQEGWKNMASTLASGSSECDGMIIAPCSMGTLGGIAAGISRNLIERAADVTLKERRPLVLVPRETPFNRIHLTNMMTLNDAGAVILPPIPSFYHNPESIEDILVQVSARVLKVLGIKSDHLISWTGEEPAEEP